MVIAMKKNKIISKEPLVPIRMSGFACAFCGQTLNIGDLHVVCPDCGALFCEDCVKDKTFADHYCGNYSDNN